MKAILLSINPIWCEEIASGKKTIEIRKTKPKLDTPFKCFIYETKGITDTPWVDEDGHLIFQGRGAVIGEFVCDEIVPIKVFWNGSIKNWLLYNLENSRVPYSDMAEYIGFKKTGYGWKIAELKIYDKPKPLSEFIHPSIGCCNEGKCRGCKFLEEGNGYNLEDDCAADFDTDMYSILRRPPQSWCYVEV